MARHAWPGYEFTDPLGAAAVAARRPAKTLARHALLAGYLLGAFTLGITLLTPDSDPSDHAGIATIGLAMLFIGALLAAWRSIPDRLLLAFWPIGSLLVTALIAIAKPIMLIPIFYIWPIVLSAYFLQRRQVAWNFALVAAGFAVSLRGWVVPDGRLIQWVSIVVVGAILTVLVVALKESLTAALVRLRLLATRDSLTGALNRRAFADELDAAVARVRRGEGSCAVAILDIDHFKRINDGYGHAAGDRALQRLTAVIEDRTRLGDVVGRLGGEEFAVLLDGTDARGAEVYADDLRGALAREASAGAPGFTVSIGVAELGDGDGTAEGMLLAADRALYAAKGGGRDRVLRATPSIHRVA